MKRFHLSNMRSLLDFRSFFIPESSHEKYYTHNELRLLHSNHKIFNNVGEEIVLICSCFSSDSITKIAAHSQLKKQPQLVIVQSLLT